MALKLVLLIVEDEPLLMMIAAETISELGFEILEARNADEAIALLEARSDVYLVFTDVNMPGSMDGLNLAHYARDRWPPLKIIVTSGKARLSTAELPSEGAFVPKPYSAQDLATAFKRMAA